LHSQSTGPLSFSGQQGVELVDPVHAEDDGQAVTGLLGQGDIQAQSRRVVGWKMYAAGAPCIRQPLTRAWAATWSRAGVRTAWSRAWSVTSRAGTP